MSAPEQELLPRIGDFVAAKYRIEEVLGRGGMGAVFRVTHAVTGKSFAVKYLLPQFHAGQEMAQRFIREAQVAGRVDHPNVVEVYDIGEDRGSMYMVMELLQGESLAQHLARVGRVQANQACQLMISVARGLAAAHRSGVIHRDLKPDNIFLSVSALGEPRPKILDFGISKMSVLASDANPALTREGVVMGTPNYMAPEQLRSHKVDERCDVYALGVILYQMLSGKLPFVGDNFPDLMLKIISDSPIPLAKAAPETPRELIRIVECAMARSPAERFDSVADLGRALEPFGQGELFDVEQKLSTRPPSSILPGAATPVATESRFPDAATDPVDLLQSARRLATPLAASALSAALFSWIYVSINRDPQPTAAAAPQAAELATHSNALRSVSSAQARPAQATRPRAQPEPHSVGSPASAPLAAAQPHEQAAATTRPQDEDALPVPNVSALDDSQLTAAAEPAPGLADAPALIGSTAPQLTDAIAIAGTDQPEAPTAPQPQSAVGAALAPVPTGSDVPKPQHSAGITAPAPALQGLAPAPVPPPGAATPEIDAAKKLKKPATKKPSAKAYSNPEIRINDFFQ